MILLLILFVLLTWSVLLMLMIMDTVKIAIALAGGVACGLVILLIMWLARFQADREERDRSGRCANER